MRVAALIVEQGTALKEDEEAERKIRNTSNDRTVDNGSSSSSSEESDAPTTTTSEDSNINNNTIFIDPDDRAELLRVAKKIVAQDDTLRKDEDAKELVDEAERKIRRGKRKIAAWKRKIWFAQSVPSGSGTFLGLTLKIHLSRKHLGKVHLARKH